MKTFLNYVNLMISKPKWFPKILDNPKPRKLKTNLLNLLMSISLSSMEYLGFHTQEN